MFTARYGLNINIQLRPFNFSPRKSGLNPRSVHVRFMVHTVEMLHVSLPVVQFPPVSSIPPMFHIHLHLHVALTRRTNGRNVGTFPKPMLFRKWWGVGGVQYWHTAVCNTDTQPSVGCWRFGFCTKFFSSRCMSVCLSLEAVSPTERSRIEVLQWSEESHS